MKSLEDRNNNNYCDIPLATTSFPSPDLCKVLLSCFHDNVVESIMVYIAHLLLLLVRQNSAMCLILIYYLVIISCKTSCNQLTPTCHFLSLFHHITFITKPLHNYIIGLKSPIMAIVHIFHHGSVFFCFCVFCFCFSLYFFSFFLFKLLLLFPVATHLLYGLSLILWINNHHPFHVC